MRGAHCGAEIGAGKAGPQPIGALPNICPFCAQHEARAERASPFKEQKESPPELKAGEPPAAGGALPAGVLENKNEEVLNPTSAALHTVRPGHAVLVHKTRDDAPFLLVNCRAQLPEQGRSCSRCNLQEEKEVKTAHLL